MSPGADGSTWGDAGSDCRSPTRLGMDQTTGCILPRTTRTANTFCQVTAGLRTFVNDPVEELKEPGDFVYSGARQLAFVHVVYADLSLDYPAKAKDRQSGVMVRLDQGGKPVRRHSE